MMRFKEEINVQIFNLQNEKEDAKHVSEMQSKIDEQMRNYDVRLAKNRDD